MSIHRTFSSFPSSGSQWKYDVFLSFRGDDTRKGFTDHLYTALEDKGIITFRDDIELGKGTSISPELSTAIERSRFSLIIISQNYGSSTWCLDELQKILHCMEAKETVLPIFYHVDPSDVRKQTGPFAEAFIKHEKRFRNEKEKVQRWRDALRSVANLSGWNSKESYESQLVKDIAEVISKKLHSTWCCSVGNLVGIDSRLKQINSLLGGCVDDVRFIGIWGMHGVGKTTIARVVYERISSEFEFSLFVDNVGNIVENGGLVNLQRQLISGICMINDGISNLYEGTAMIRRLFCHIEPGRRSRLWLREDVNRVLSKNTGTEAIEGIVLHPTEPGLNVHANSKSFSTMKNLRFLEIDNVILPNGLEHLPDSLQILKWTGYPATFLPSSFSPEKILELSMCHSCIYHFRTGIKPLYNLKILNLSHSLNLLSMPNFRAMPYLEVFILEGCRGLYEVDPSIEALERLGLLNLKDCRNLVHFSSSIYGLKSLKVLNLFRLFKAK